MAGANTLDHDVFRCPSCKDRGFVLGTGDGRTSSLDSSACPLRKLKTTTTVETKCSSCELYYAAKALALAWPIQVPNCMYNVNNIDSIKLVSRNLSLRDFIANRPPVLHQILSASFRSDCLGP